MLWIGARTTANPFAVQEIADALKGVDIPISVSYTHLRSNAIGIPLLAVIQGGIATLGYYLFDVPSALLFGFLTCFATVIPIALDGARMSM